MNKIVLENDIYTLITEDGSRYTCKTWFEKKTNEYHVVLPKDNPTGRTYIRLSKIVNGLYEFENKTSGPRILSNWRTRLTSEELRELEEYEKGIERLKNLGLSRTIDKNSPEYIEAEIRKLQEKLIESRKLQEKSI